MTNKLENLLSQPMTPCPHCGTPNGADSETCLCCGKRMQELPQAPAPEISADGETAEQPAADVPEQTAAQPPADEAPDDADKPAPLSPQQKRKRRLFIALTVVSNALLLTMLLIQAMYLDSAGYRTAKLFRADRAGAARQLYLQEVMQSDTQLRILRREMYKYFDELDAQYRAEKLDFQEYTEKCSSILRMYHDKELSRDVKNRLHAELERIYDSYLHFIMGQGGADYPETLFAFSNVINNDLAPDSRTEELFARFGKVNEAESSFASAQNCENAGQYKDAIWAYQKIDADSPRYEAAASGLHRCVTAYCADLRTRMTQADRSVPTLWEFRYEAANVLALWPENGDLQELHAEVQQQYCTALKQKTLNEAADPQCDPYTLITALKNVLKELPGDGELQTALDGQIVRLKAELPGKLLDILQDSDLGWGEAMWHMTAVRELLPEDADISALYQRMSDFENNRWRVDDGDTGITDLFQRYVEGDTSAWFEYNTTPVKDASGAYHEPYALYRFTAVSGNPAAWKVWGNGYTTLRCKMFADPGCTGTGVLELWVVRTAGDDARWEKYWTSPVLNRTTNGYEVNITMPADGFEQMELRLVSRTGTVVLLLDEAYLE